MVPLGSLLLPVVLSAVLVFFASFLVHMVLRYHSSDYTQLPNEDAVRAAIRAGNPAPRQYIIPYCKDPKEMQSPEMVQKHMEGPVAVLNLRAPAKPTMGPYLTSGSCSIWWSPSSWRTWPPIPSRRARSISKSSAWWAP